MHAATPPEQLWLVRHGQSTGNVARDSAEAERLELVDVHLRDMDVPLSPLGEEQARALGRWLRRRPADELPTVVLCSPFTRARQTAELAMTACGAGLGGLPVRVDERLRDRDLGVLDRLTWRGIVAQYPEQAELRRRVGKFYHRPPGGEAWTDVLLRLRSMQQTLTQTYAGERVLLFAHDVVVLLFRYLLEDLDERRVLALGRDEPVANCGLTTYHRADERLVLTAYNEVAPLAEEDAPVTVEQGEHVRAR